MRLIALLPLALFLLLTGCSGGRDASEGRPTVYGPPSGTSCVRYWNGTSNDANRAHVRKAGYERAEVTVRARSHAAPGQSLSCNFLFHDGDSYLALGGAWNGVELVWGFPPTAKGRWQPRRAGTPGDDAAVRADGRLRER